GERVLAENIIPVGAGPEDYQPAPQDAQKIAEADINSYVDLLRYNMKTVVDALT
ncbi:MAG: hypothetical protein H7Y32_12220, partial [Chloroflexales bacterium]|nr:hypothetical protein [Chloroflexales bacterium]